MSIGRAMRTPHRRARPLQKLRRRVRADTDFDIGGSSVPSLTRATARTHVRPHGRVRLRKCLGKPKSTLELRARIVEPFPRSRELAMDETLLHVVHSRLESSEGLEGDAAILVLAACEGPAALRDVLSGARAPEAAPPNAPSAPNEPVGAFLDGVGVTGFRGIGQRASLDFTPGPGLTLVVGRNGSGKSSFAEALEVLLTGDNQRWAGRTVVWKEGWRNLHQDGLVEIVGRFLTAGELGPTAVRRTWAASAELDEGVCEVQPHGKPRTDLPALGWSDALVAYRPFLSYNELGSLLEEGPSKLYDALSSILGLEDLVAVEQSLADERKSREKALREVKAQLESIRASLRTSEDERGAKCLDALAGQAWDLDSVEAVVTGIDEEMSAETELALLRALSTLESPAPLPQVGVAIRDLREAAQRQTAIAASASARAREAATILSSALTFHEHHGDGECPVCGASGALDADWRQQAQRKAAELRASAAEADGVEAAAREAEVLADACLQAPPSFVAEASPASIGVDVEHLLQVWEDWSIGTPRNSLDALASHLEDRVLELNERIEEVRARAKELLDQKEDAWRPVAVQLAAWLKAARSATQGVENIRALKEAEGWVRETETQIRDERFEPIADEATRIWELLRTRSNVELAAVKLEGAGNRRRVSLDVRVDGVDGAALGVMSQGELHSLALSLFFPRATLPESPLRFIVIDDPVQSMDPSRVDGLARVLDEVAKSRQVIVFTHDDRLPMAVRQLGIDSTILEVTRRTGSVVEIRKSLDPVERYLDDAKALALTEDLPAEVGKHVVPGFCRSALEAACVEVIRKRRLRRGEAHEAVDQALEDATTLNLLASLALFDDIGRGGDVLARLNQWGRWAADTFQTCKAGSHSGYGGSLMDLVRDTQSLASKVRELA